MIYASAKIDMFTLIGNLYSMHMMEISNGTSMICRDVEILCFYVSVKIN
jgi:hypothetical protein